jgi:GntR family transcriptional regulator, rspAB operon transcriptional repressor
MIPGDLIAAATRTQVPGARLMKTDASLAKAPPIAPEQDGGAVSLKHRAYIELKGRILSGTLPPGTLLSERQLARGLKMSKTPVHAALERLEGDGLVTVAAQQGIVVRAISPRDIADHFEIREALETFVVRRLAGRLTSEQVERLNRNVADNRRAIRRGDVEANIRLDSEFHVLLCEFHGNGEITRAMGQIRDKIHGVIHLISTRFPQRMNVSMCEHEAIVASLVEGDGATAAARIIAHLRNGLQSVYDHRP